MSDALGEWERRRHQDHAHFIRDLFFSAGGGSPGASKPTDLARAVKLERQLDDDAFDNQRRAIFTEFATFLLDFVTPQQRTQRLSGNRWLWILAACLLVLLAVGVPLVRHLIAGTGQESGSDGARSGSPGDTQSAVEPQVFVFDALGGGSRTITVYPGVTADPKDRVANGTFEDGQSTTALCKTTGRTVHSDPAVGESVRASDVWVRVTAQPGRTSYASLTYGRMSAAVLDSLPPC